MASPTSPTHGKLAAVYALRPNGFKGSGLNDVTWGTGFNGASSAYYEAVIDSELGGGGGVDTFKWRKNGGSWTEDADITGAAQTLDEGQQITFGADTGHTLDDQWVIGNLKDEACIESGVEAQIAALAKRIVNPNSPPVFSDTGSQLVKTIDYTQGRARFDGNVTVVTVTGNNGYIVPASLEQVGYLIGWNFAVDLDMEPIPRAGQDWKEWLPGMAGGSGGAEAYFIGGKTFFEAFKEGVEGQPYFFLELYNYDPDKDQTGDHFNAWVTFNGFNLDAPINAVVKEAVSFQLQGQPSFTPNT